MKHNLEIFHEVREIMYENDMVKMHKITLNNAVEKIASKSQKWFTRSNGIVKFVNNLE